MEVENVFTEKQEQIVKVLKRFVEKGDLPHLLFSGPPGCGKTTCALALSKELYGENWHRNYFELNASDENGVEVMRGKIKDYTKIVSVTHPFKLLFLDESDYLTPNAQSVLRRTIEEASEKCRFVLSCNYPNKIIPAIADRCATFRFSKIKAQDMKMFLKPVAEGEGININDSALHLLATLSDGSMRRSLNMLQVLKLSGEEQVTDKNIYDYMYWIDYDDVRRLLSSIKTKSLKASDVILNELLYKKSYEIKEIIKGLYQEIKESKEFDDYFKIRALDRLNEVEFHISMGSDTEIQLRTYMAHLMKIYGGK